MKKLLSILLLISSTSALAQNSIYKTPSEISSLPDSVRIELEKDRCQVPTGILGHTNVIKGSFAKLGQTDWAVLCSVSGNSHIKIIWGGSARCPSKIAERPDDTYMYEPEKRKVEYLRGLAVVGKNFIVDHHKAYGGPTPPLIKHDAIDDRYLEKASVVHYCDDGKWHQLTGAD